MNLLELYRDGQDLERAGKTTEAVHRWHEAVKQTDGSQPAWLGTWPLFHEAEELAAARQWRQADDAYQEVIEKAVGSDPRTEAQLPQAWADTYLQRSDWNKAEKYYLRTLALSGKLADESLLVAKALKREALVPWGQG